MNNLITGRSSNYCEKSDLGMRTKAFYCLCFLFEGARPAIYCSHKTRGRKNERYYHTEQIHRYTQAAREGKINQCTHTYFFTHWRTHKKRLCSAYDESTVKTEQMRAMATGKD